MNKNARMGKMNDCADITAYVQQLNWTPEPTCKYLASGYGNDNYILDWGDHRYVLRKKRTDEFPDSLQREYTLYLFLEDQGLEFTPRSIYFDHTENILIESFLAGEEVLHNQLSPAQIRCFARQLFTLNTLSISALYEFCSTHVLPPIPELDALHSLQLYGYDRFQDIDIAVVGRETTNWIKERLDQNYDMICEQANTTTLSLLWGDVQESVFCGNTNTLHFFDFEHARIGHGNDLMYIHIHSSFTAKQFEILLKEYATLANTSTADLWSTILAEERITRVNDVVWAARQWSITGQEKYAKLTRSRQALVE